MFNFLLEANTIDTLRIIYIVGFVVVIVLCILPGIIKKRKIAKLDSADPQATADYQKLRLHSCPICKEAYTMTDNTVTVVDRPARLICGTFYGEETSKRYNKILTCSKCDYRIDITHHHSVTRDDACRETVEDTYHWELTNSGSLSDADKQRIQNAIIYKRKREKIEKD